VRAADAVRVCRLIIARRSAPAGAAPALFATAGRSAARQRAGLPAMASSAVHALLIGIAIWFSAGAANIAYYDDSAYEPSRLVFVVSPGPGGGGGGGVLRNHRPAPKVQR